MNDQIVPLKRYRKMSIVDILQLVFALTLMAYSLYQLYAPDNRPQHFSLEKKMGFITNIKNAVQIKSLNQLNWLPLEESSPVYQFDQVFTGSEGQVRIELDEGLTVEMLPHTIMRLAPSLELQGGVYRLEFGKKRRTQSLLLNGARIDITGVEGEVLINQHQSTILVQTGTVEIQHDRKDPIKLQAQEHYHLPSQIISHGPLFTLITPTPPFQLHIFDEINIPFHWEYPSPLDFKISSLTSKEPLVIERSSVSKKLDVKLHGPGTYRFEFALQDKTLQRGTLQLLPTLPPRWLSPSDGSHFYFYEKNEWRLPLSWQEGAPPFDLVVEKVGGSRQDLLVGGFQTSIEILQSGHYRLRLKSRKEGLWSSPLEVHIHLADALAQEPADLRKIVLTRPDQLVTLEWRPSGSGNHALELAQDPQFKSLILHKETSQDRLEMVFPRLGTYYWRVYELTDGKRNYLKAQKVLIVPSPPPERPKLKEKIERELQRKKTSRFFLWDWLLPLAHGAETFVPLDWKSSPEAKSYEVEIFKDPALTQKIHETQVKEPYYEWETGRTGRFYWRVRILDFWNQHSPWSNTSELLIKKSPQASVIALETPAHRARIEGEGAFLRFDWAPYSPLKGRSYTFKLSRDLSFSSPYFEQKITSSKIDLPRRLIQKGLNYWRVEIDGMIKSKRRAIWHAPATPKAPPGKTPLPPTAIRPLGPNPQKTSPRPPPVLQRNRQTQRRRSPPSPSFFLDAMLLPTFVEYRLRGGELEANIDGVALQSLALSAHYRRSPWELHLFAHHQSGVVFEEIGEELPYQDLWSELFGLWQLRNKNSFILKLGAGVSFHSLTQYSLNRFKQIQEEGQQLLSAPLYLNLSWDLSSQMKLDLSAQYLIGGETGPGARLKLSTSWRSPYELSGGLLFRDTQWSANGLELEKTQWGLFVGLGRTF